MNLMISRISHHVSIGLHSKKNYNLHGSTKKLKKNYSDVMGKKYENGEETIKIEKIL